MVLIHGLVLGFLRSAAPLLRVSPRLFGRILLQLDRLEDEQCAASTGRGPAFRVWFWPDQVIECRVS